MRFYGPIVLFTLLMFSASLLTASAGGPAPFFMTAFYLAGEIVPFVIAAGAFVFCYIAGLARQRADDPLFKARVALRPKLSLWALPLVAFPIFLGSFTATKSAIPVIIGYHSDATLASVDRMLFFGTDPWRITHYFIRSGGTTTIQFVYVAVWIPLLASVIAALPFFASRVMAGRFYAAMFATWLIGGFALAYLMSSVGPIFAHLVDPALGAEFSPLRTHLDKMLGSESALRVGQSYLEDRFRSNLPAPGAGISAMPSMHVAMAALYVFAAHKTWVIWPALIFLLTIIVGSVHSGFHYFVDAPVGIAIAALCWWGAGRWYEPKKKRASGRPIEGEPPFPTPALNIAD